MLERLHDAWICKSKVALRLPSTVCVFFSVRQQPVSKFSSLSLSLPLYREKFLEKSACRVLAVCCKTFFFKAFFQPLTILWFFVALQLLTLFFVLKPGSSTTEMVPKPLTSFPKCYQNVFAVLALHSPFNTSPVFIPQLQSQFVIQGHLPWEPQGNLFLPFHSSPAFKYSVPSLINPSLFLCMCHASRCLLFSPFWGPNANISSSFLLPTS